MIELPAKIAENLPMIVSGIKAFLVLTIISKYSSSKLMPFVRSIYQFCILGNICKLLFFFPPTEEPKYVGGGGMIETLQDLSFVFQLMGVVVTMSLDFLWALSSALESDPIFHRDISESDFVIGWFKMQLPILLGLLTIRHAPSDMLPMANGKCFQIAIQIILMLSFGFVWLCLLKVYGKSDTPRFRKAYTAAFVVNFLCSGLVAQNGAMTWLLVSDQVGEVSFLQMEHFLETTGILLILCYFMFLKAAPADLQTAHINMKGVRGVIRAKCIFKNSLGIHCKKSAAEHRDD